MKSYTNIEQSKVLAKILPLESADMWWLYVTSQGKHIAMMYEEPDPHYVARMEGYGLKDFAIRCWSLAALLDVLPQSITKYIESERCQKTFHLNLFRSYYYCCSYSFSPSISDDDGDNTLYCIGRDNWVDACYEMIIKLHELNLL